MIFRCPRRKQNRRPSHLKGLGIPGLDCVLKSVVLLLKTCFLWLPDFGFCLGSCVSGSHPSGQMDGQQMGTCIQSHPPIF